MKGTIFQYLLRVAAVLCLLWEQAGVAHSLSGDEQANIVQFPNNKISGEINFRITTIDLRTNKTEKRDLTIHKTSLIQMNATIEQIKQGWIEVLPNGDKELVLQDKRVLLQIKPKLYKLMDPFTGKHSFTIDISILDAQRIQDIRDDKTLVPLPPKEVEWKIPSKCFMNSLSLYVNGSSVELQINGKRTMKYTVRKDESPWGVFIDEGLLLTVLNPLTCKITLQLVASTSDITGCRDLLWGLNSISPGKVVLIASLRDGAAYLGEEARNAVQKMGSSWVSFYLYRDSWLNLFVKGGKTIQDVLIPNLGKQNASGSPVSFHFDPQQLFPQQLNDCPSWPQTQRWKARKIFCDSHDGFPDLCACERPLEFKSWRSLEAVKIPILIMAGHRTRHFYRLLMSLESQENVTKETLMLVSSGYVEDVTRLAFILDLKLLVHRPESTGVVEISRNLRFTLYHGFQSFSQAETFIILEDDLVLSPDFYSFMVQMEPIFKMDQTVFCVNAFSHLSYPHTSGDPTMMYRVRSFPAYGWMMPRNILEEIVPKWLPITFTFEWDYYFGAQFIRKGRDCIVPDINRSYHWSTKGVHSGASRYTSEVYYLSRNFNQDPKVKLRPLERLRKEDYEAEFKSLMKKSVAVNFTKKSDLDEIISPGKVFAIYVFQKNENDDSSFRAFALAFGIWTYDIRDHHNFAWRFLYKNATVIVVGVPTSPYRVYIPRNHPTVKGNNETDLMILQDEYDLRAQHQIQTHEGLLRLPTFGSDAISPS